MIILRFFSALLLVIFLLNTYARADNIALTNEDLQKKNIYYVIDVEGGKWFYSKLKISPNRLQENLETRYFNNKADLDMALEKQIPNFNLNKDISLKNLATTELHERSIWKTENEWNWEWEQKYAIWIQNNVDQKFFYKKKIATDCADVAIAARWIFARIYKLPAAQSLAGSNVLFSNDSFKEEWANLATDVNWEKDILFRTALDYVLNNTYTHSLWNDSYPIQIAPESFLQGTYHLIIRGHTGHTQLVNYFNTQNFELIYSDVPRKIRKLYSVPFAEDMPIPGKSAFVKMRWPVQTPAGLILKDKNEMPYYSLNQYSEGLEENEIGSYAFGFLKAIGLVPNIEDYFTDAVKNLYYGFSNRIQIVEEGFKFCSVNDCSEGTENYENHSTPSRDAKLVYRVAIIMNMLESGYPDLLDKWDYIVRNWTLEIEGDTYHLDYLSNLWLEAKFSVDPNDSIRKRWGFE